MVLLVLQSRIPQYSDARTVATSAMEKPGEAWNVQYRRLLEPAHSRDMVRMSDSRCAMVRKAGVVDGENASWPEELSPTSEARPAKVLSVGFRRK
jgi:hypothetical protein